MDGREVQRLRLAEKTAAELQLQNTHLSAELLRMQGVLEEYKKRSAIDRLLAAALVERFSQPVPAGVADLIVAAAELRIAEVDDLRHRMSEFPGLSLHLEKNEDAGIWMIALAKNPANKPIIRDCQSCGGEHIDPPTREPTDQEKAAGATIILQCPVNNVDVAMIGEKVAKPKIEIAR